MEALGSSLLELDAHLAPALLQAFAGQDDEGHSAPAVVVNADHQPQLFLEPLQRLHEHIDMPVSQDSSVTVRGDVHSP